MKFKITQMEVEATAAEAREALPGILHATPTSGPVIAPATPVAIEAPDVTPRAIEAAESPDEIVLPHEREPEEEWTPHAGPRSAPPTQPFERWEDIPADRRLWGPGCHTAHILKDQDDPFSTYCGHDVGTANNGRRIPAMAKVCGNCNRRIMEAQHA